MVGVTAEELGVRHPWKELAAHDII